MPEATITKPAGGNTVRGLECPLCRQRAHQHVMTYPAHNQLFLSRTVARCVDCGLVYMYPMASTAMLNAYYNSGTFWGHVADKTPFDIPTYHHQAQARVDFIKDRLKFGKQIDVLDIGAGYGVLESYLVKLLPATVQCFAVEPDQKAQQSLERHGIVWKAELEEFANKKFDLIILSHVFEHINAPVEYLKNLKAYFNPEGYLFIEVPNGDYRFKFDLEPHVLFFEPKSLSKVLAAGGFRSLYLETCGLPWTKQREMNDAIRARNGWIDKLPMRDQLRRIKNFLKPKKNAGHPDPLSAPDPYHCREYGDDRVWIRCLAGVQP